MRALQPHLILKRELKRKQATHPSYSMRALARDLGVSSSYLSAVLNGRKPVPLGRMDEIARRLDMDELAVRTLKSAVALSQLPEAPDTMLSNAKTLDYLAETRQADRSDLDLWSKWYFVATLDLSTCDNFVSDVKWIARRLNIPLGDAVEAVDFLLRRGFMIERDGRWVKVDTHLRMPTVTSVDIVRRYHKQYMLKAIDVMQSQTTPEEFAKRLITGVVVASSPAKIAEARRRLELALVEVSKILLDGECTELYQLGAQLYPLTSKG